MNLRVSRVRIQNFRGVPSSLLLDLRPEHNDKPVSLILSGDNGTGKSSVVDAFEFALQGRIARRRDYLNSNTPSAVSIVNEGACEVSVELTDGNVRQRSITQGANGKLRTEKRPDPNFAVSPFVLRRSDILQFWDAPEHQRQLIFSDYLRDPKIESEAWSATQKEQIEKLLQAKREEKRRRIALSERLAAALNMDRKQVPLDPKQFDTFVRNTLYQGLSTTERRYKGWKWREKNKIPTQEQGLVRAIRECSRLITKFDAQIRKIKGKSSYQLESLLGVLGNSNEPVTEAFCSISPNRSFVEKIEFVYGKVTEVSLSLNVHLVNGRILSPQQVFSEANLDLLAMLIFLAVAKESAKRGQAKFLILDDVLQSVDASIRLAVTEYIVKEFDDWQLVFTLHERLWQEQLRNILRRYNHQFVEHDIVRWSFKDGPIIVSSRRNPDSLLKEALMLGDVSGICAQSGLLLERICDVLSYALPLQLPRKKDNKYTLGELWPRLQKYLIETTSRTNAAEVERWLHLRNLVGAHYNEWAQNLSRQEAQFFGEAVLNLLTDVHCDKCYRWVSRKWAGLTGDDKCELSCHCQKTQIMKL